MDFTTNLIRPVIAPYRLVHMLLGALALRRQRRKLASLNDAMLRDIGITREQAMAEALRPVWDVPAHWRG
jgi:uncharacterized protein YjiS (DUF1127 family)